jgi:serine/threonine protein kinase
MLGCVLYVVLLQVCCVVLLPGCGWSCPLASCSAVERCQRSQPASAHHAPSFCPLVPSSQSFGTASYAAPELLTEGKLTRSADIFSLAIVAWELSAAAATGAAQELHPGMTAMQVIMQVSQHQLRPEVAPGCPPQLADLIRRCWSQDPAQRCAAAPLGAASWQWASQQGQAQRIRRRAAQPVSVSHQRLPLCTPACCKEPLNRLCSTTSAAGRQPLKLWTS